MRQGKERSRIHRAYLWRVNRILALGLVGLSLFTFILWGLSLFWIFRWDGNSVAQSEMMFRQASPNRIRIIDGHLHVWVSKLIGDGVPKRREARLPFGYVKFESFVLELTADDIRWVIADPRTPALVAAYTGHRLLRIHASLPLMVLVVFFALYPIVWFIHERWTRTWRAIHYCRKCSYDLTGNISGRCPECGTPIPGHSSVNSVSGNP